MAENVSLYDALLACRTPEELRCFLDDLLSPEEIERAKDRWGIAAKHLSDPDVFTQSKLKQLGYGSSDKIGRIIRPIRSEKSGYRIAYKRLMEEQKHSVGEAK